MITKKKAKVELSMTPTIEGASLSELVWMLYGPPGIGKSTFFSKIKGALFLHTDPGLRFIKTAKKPILSWKQFKEVTESIVARPPDGCNMVIIDTADLLFRMCRQFVCKKRNIEHVSDEEWGKGHDMLRDEFELPIAQLTGLSNKGIGLAFISHSKEIEIRGRTVRTSKTVPALPGAAHKIITPLCDIIGYAGYSVGKADKSGGMPRIIHFDPDETVEAKDRTGLLPARCKLDFDEVSGHLEEGGYTSTAPARSSNGLKKKKRKKRAV